MQLLLAIRAQLQLVAARAVEHRLLLQLLHQQRLQLQLLIHMHT